jgi:hypothetical protein
MDGFTLSRIQFGATFACIGVPILTAPFAVGGSSRAK